MTDSPLSSRAKRAQDKLSRIPIKVEPMTEAVKKPDWIRVKLAHTDKVTELKQKLRDNELVTVCEQAACPNLPECFAKGTATFMIMGENCTRRCAFCDVGHGRPEPLDPKEPIRLAKTIADLKLRYIVITSVDRDDLRDGGASHFSACLRAVRAASPDITIEVLVPDFRGRLEKALEAMGTDLPDVFNHNIETAPRLYKQARPGSDFQVSLTLLQTFKERYAGIPTKSGMMLGLGETDKEVFEVMEALRAHDVDRLTLGQYLQPTRFHLPVKRFVTPEQFNIFAKEAYAMGFSHVASGPLVRSSYHADKQAAGEVVS